MSVFRPHLNTSSCCPAPKYLCIAFNLLSLIVLFEWNILHWNPSPSTRSLIWLCSGIREAYRYFDKCCQRARLVLEGFRQISVDLYSLTSWTLHKWHFSQTAQYMPNNISIIKIIHFDLQHFVLFLQSPPGCFFFSSSSCVNSDYIWIPELYMSNNGDLRVTEVEGSRGTCCCLSKGPLHSSTMLSGSYLTLMVNDLGWWWGSAAGLEIKKHRY